MAYNNSNANKEHGFLVRLKFKVGKLIAQKFPLNSIRVIGLKLCEFEIGEKVYIGPDLIVASIISDKSCKLIIGNRVALGPRVTLILSSDANWSNLMKKIPYIRDKIVLEDDCWIGAGVTILPGITIGKMSIIGAGSVVTKNVPPYSVFAGVPAKYIKKSVEQ